MIEKKNSHEDLLVFIDRLTSFFKLAILAPIVEIYRGLMTGALPQISCGTVGVILSSALLFHADDKILRYFGREPSFVAGRVRGILGIVLLFLGFIGWAY